MVGVYKAGLYFNFFTSFTDDRLSTSVNMKTVFVFAVLCIAVAYVSMTSFNFNKFKVGDSCNKIHVISGILNICTERHFSSYILWYLVFNNLRNIFILFLKTFQASLYSLEKHFLFDNFGFSAYKIKHSLWNLIFVSDWSVRCQNMPCDILQLKLKMSTLLQIIIADFGCVRLSGYCGI